MTQAEMLSLYADAKEQVEFCPPTRISPRCKWRVKKFPFRVGWYRSTKAEVAKILSGYGLTVEEFITAAIQTFWLGFEERCGDTEHAYLKKRFPYAFKVSDNPA